MAGGSKAENILVEAADSSAGAERGLPFTRFQAVQLKDLNFGEPNITPNLGNFHSAIYILSSQ